MQPVSKDQQRIIANILVDDGYGRHKGDEPDKQPALLVAAPGHRATAPCRNRTKVLQRRPSFVPTTIFILPET